MSRTAAAIEEAVQSIPVGSCASYGAIGRSLERPISGLLVGKLLSFCAPDVPWWRVVGSDGSLLIGRRDAALAVEQARRLEEEGILLIDGRVPMGVLTSPE